MTTPMTRLLNWRSLLAGVLGAAALAVGAFFAYGAVAGRVTDPFDRGIAGLPEATKTALVELRDGDVFELRAGMVRKRIGNATVKMLAYNGSVPGPTLRVAQGAEVTVRVTNDTDLETTVHWHGLRLENRFDGVPHETQEPIPVGGSFTYRLRFPDAGVYWYHPHVREDYGQELGLYGNIVVVPAEPDYCPPANREIPLVLDDVLLEGGAIAPFSRSTPNRTAMGRFGNVMLVNGETEYRLEARRGEVVRLYVTNTANARTFDLRLPGARLKLIGVDNGRVEREAFVEGVLLAPSERAVVDVLFESAGRLALEHRTPDRTYTVGAVVVDERPAEPSFAPAFAALRAGGELAAERATLAADLDRPADKTLALVGDMAGMGQHGGGGGHQHGGIEWEDTMAGMNRRSSPKNMFWKLIDRATGDENHHIRWAFAAGERVKLRLVNEAEADHPMQHPFHVHGQRFLVFSRDGVPNPDLAWKDTVLVRTGETVDLLVEMSNPGTWMAHCHIAEHVEGGMMLSFWVGEGAPHASPHPA
jgi:FtsP/CotA-like multicopper oxidase with cupredoxin domain